MRLFPCFFLLNVIKMGFFGCQLIFFLTGTLIHFFFLNVLPHPPRSPSLDSPQPSLPSHLEKICLINWNLGKLSLLAHLSISIPLLSSPFFSRLRFPVSVVQWNTLMYTERYTLENTCANPCKEQIYPLCVCILVSRLGTD